MKPGSQLWALLSSLPESPLCLLLSSHTSWRRTVSSLKFWKRELTEKWELPCWLRSSTKMISLRKAFGAVSIMLCTVLSRVDQASSWKQMMTLAVGRLESYFCCRHLHGWNEEDSGNTGTKGQCFLRAKLQAAPKPSGVESSLRSQLTSKKRKC